MGVAARGSVAPAWLDADFVGVVGVGLVVKIPEQPAVPTMRMIETKNE